MTKMIDAKWGEAMRKARKERGLSIEAVAEMMDVSTNSVGRWERGKQYPDPIMRAVIKDVLGLDLPERKDA